MYAVLMGVPVRRGQRGQGLAADGCLAWEGPSGVGGAGLAGAYDRAKSIS